MNSSTAEGVVSKRRPRQNIVSLILGHSKSSSSISLPPRAIGFSVVDGKKRSNSSSSSSRLLRSAIELTRRSKTFTSRHNNSSSRGKKSKTFVKGQRAFYRSTRGIEKVTVVGVHHDAKLVPYYTIQLRDGKEKQTDGKHLNHVKDDVAGKVAGSGETIDKGKSVSESDGGRGVAGEVEAEGGGSKSTGSDNDTDPMTESSGESNVKDEGVDSGKLAQRGSGEEITSSQEKNNAAGHGTNRFTVGHDAYYRAPDGSITKIRVISIHHDSSTKKIRYTINLPDGSLLEGVKHSQLATLLELSSKELSLLMKERNNRQPSSTSTKSNHLSVRRSSSSTHEDIIAVDKGGDAENLEHLASSKSDLSGSLNNLNSKKISRTASPITPSSVTSASNEKQESPHVPTVRMVQAKTEDGKSKTVPLYEAGMTLNYKNAVGVQECTILSVHLDDLLEPYYDVRLKDGHEKQTDNAHLMLKSESVAEDSVGDSQGAQMEIGGVSGETEKCQVSPKAQQQSLSSSGEKAAPPSSSKKEVSEDACDNVCLDDANRSDTAKHPKHDTASASLASSAGISNGSEVIYTSSEGEQIRAVVLKLHHDKKNRPYYVVRLHSTGKEKQVYGHRLQLLCSSQDNDEQLQNRRSRSRSRGGLDHNEGSARHDRGRSNSKASKSDGNAGSNRRTDPAPRSDSIDSRRSSLSNSSRRAAERKEKSSSRRERDESRTRDRHAHDPIGTTSRSRSISSLRQGRIQVRSSGSGVAESRVNHSSGGSRERSQSRTRVESKERTSSRVSGEGRERSRSRAPGEGSKERACSRAPSVDSRASSSHGNNTSRPKQSMSNGKKLNSSLGNDGPSSSKQSSSKGQSATESESSSMTGRSIAKLKSFRRNFSAMKKR